MPTPARTSLGKIVAAGRKLVEEGGLDALTMQGVADLVGVRAPSLYNHVAGRDQLVGLVAESAVEDLASTLAGTDEDAPPADRLVALGTAFRRFALSNPGAYGLIFSPLTEPARLDVARLAAASAPVVGAATALVGSDHALEAARTVTAWAHGFVSMELAGAFQLGGDVDAAFDYGARLLATALASTGAA